MYDLDDLEDTSADGMTTQAQYDAATAWKYNQDVDIIVAGLIEAEMYDSTGPALVRCNGAFSS